jgi:hypothetical protein
MIPLPSTPGGGSGIPSINGGDAGPSSADSAFGDSFFGSPSFSAPFVFGGSGGAVTSTMLVIALAVGGLIWLIKR